MSFGSFLSQVGVSAGRSILVGQQMDATQAHTDLQNAEVQESKARMAQLAQSTETKKAVGGYIQAKMAEDKASVDDPQKAAQVFTGAAAIATSRGDFTTARELDTLAHDKATQAKERRQELTAEIQLKREGLARTAMDFARTGSLTDATEVAKAAIAAGVNPLDIPKPNTPEFKAWAKQQETAAMSSKEVLAAKEKEREFDDRAAARKEEAERRHQEREEQRADRAESQRASRELRKQLADAAAEERKSRNEERVGKTQFIQTEKLSKEAQHEAEPLLKDLNTVHNIQNLLATDSPVADQQIRQALPALLGGLKGRATNPYYKDSAHFGDVVQKLSDVFSRGFTGRYSEETRRQISQLVTDMQENVLEPGITRIEKDQKSKAVKYGLDPELIEVQGDFTRRSPKTKPDSKAADALPAEGVTRTINGVTYRSLGGGKWEQQ